jgi:hypothetical protein
MAGTTLSEGGGSLMNNRAWLLVMTACAAAAGGCETEDLPIGQGPVAGDAGDHGSPGGSAATAGRGPLEATGGAGGAGGTGGSISPGGDSSRGGEGAGSGEGGAGAGGAGGEPPMLDCEALGVRENEGTAHLSVDQYCEFVDAGKPCPRTYDKAFEQMAPATCSEGNTRFQLRQGCGARTLEWNGGLFAYSYSYDVAGNLVGASRYDDVAFGVCEEFGASRYVAGEDPFDCEEATTCQPCGNPPELAADCSDSGVDCSDGKLSDLAGFCRRFSDFFPGISQSGDCPATLEEAKALFEPSCADEIDIEYQTGCDFESITLRFADQRRATLTYLGDELIRAQVSAMGKLAELGFGPCDELGNYWAGLRTVACSSGWSTCSWCSPAGNPSDLADCPR